MVPKYSLATVVLLLCCVSAAGPHAALMAQQAASGAAQSAPVVQPGAPGQPSKMLTGVTAVATAKPPSEADIRFMQDMIMHHGQAVEMTELLKTRSQDAAVTELGNKIDVSQSDEIKWMKNWLAERGIPVEAMSASMPGMAGMDHSSKAGMDHSKMDKPAVADTAMDVAMMPGMLTPRQMNALRAADGHQFDVLFLTGMMQHHNGALLMVKQLFANPGAGQDPQLFDFANDVDNTQQAEIDIMKGILRKVQP